MITYFCGGDIRYLCLAPRLTFRGRVYKEYKNRTEKTSSDQDTLITKTGVCVAIFFLRLGVLSAQDCRDSDFADIMQKMNILTFSRSSDKVTFATDMAD